MTLLATHLALLMLGASLGAVTMAVVAAGADRKD